MGIATNGTSHYQGNNLLRVWGDINEPAQHLLDGLNARGWDIVQCGWQASWNDSNPQKSHVCLVILDDNATDHLARMGTLFQHDNGTEWVFICSPQTAGYEVVRSALANHAFAYHYLPCSAGELDIVLLHAQSMAVLHDTVSTAARDYFNNSAEYEMVGTGSAMRQLFREIRKLASVDAPVLIRGESGTGKELAAQSIHERSARANGPFVAINCGSLPSELVQSELFGHEKGAFTGASHQRIGNIESAAGGTLLLDEIGDLPLSLQVHLLRFLQTGRIQRVGSNTTISVDVRVLAATHVPLEKAINEGRFREDLYHRLNVVSLNIPPLRERAEDIEVLAQFFFRRFAAERPTRIHGISQEALQSLCHHRWPGNVRELINRMRRAVVMGEGRLITPADLNLDDSSVDADDQTRTLEVVRVQAERKHLQATLMRNRGRVAAAARDLGVSRVTLYRLLKKHNMDIAIAKESPGSATERQSTARPSPPRPQSDRG